MVVECTERGDLTRLINPEYVWEKDRHPDHIPPREESEKGPRCFLCPCKFYYYYIYNDLFGLIGPIKQCRPRSYVGTSKPVL